ncbi:DUF5011 domain-containing protein [Opitutales bacterium]|nr:DUF5011 domain-containing protein [Opitutales bacterium]
MNTIFQKALTNLLLIGVGMTAWAQDSSSSYRFGPQAMLSLSGEGNTSNAKAFTVVESITGLSTTQTTYTEVHVGFLGALDAWSGLVALNPLEIAENKPAGSVVGEFNSTKLLGENISYQLIGGFGDGNNSLFSLDADGTLRTLGPLDYELGTRLSIRIQAKNENDETAEQDFSIDILDDFEPEQRTYSVKSAGDLELLWVEPGEFTMGHGESGTAFPEHNVTITRGYYLGKYEVTQAEYQAVMAGNELGLSSTPSNFGGFTNRPVEKVSYDDIVVFLQRLNQAEAPNLPDGWAYALPTEAQWEFAARGDTTTAYPWGDEINSSHANYNWDGNPNDGIDFQRTRDAGQYPANPWGFYDLHGNVWEWVADRMGDYSADPKVDPEGPESGDTYVTRGGSFDYDGEALRSFRREGNIRSTRYGHIGFRLALRYFNQAPVDLNSTAPLTIAENQPVGEIVGEFNATDPEGEAITYSLTEGREILGWDENHSYVQGDVVQHQGAMWRLVTEVVPEHNFSGDDLFTYDLGVVVRESNGSLYRADLNFSGVEEWSRYGSYGMDDRVKYLGELYRSNVNSGNSARTPGVHPYWTLENFGTDGEYWTALDENLTVGGSFWEEYISEYNHSLFTLDVNGTLRAATTFDYESNASSYKIRVQAKDVHNAMVEGNFTVVLLDVFEDLDGDYIEDHLDDDLDGDLISNILEDNYGSDKSDASSIPEGLLLENWYLHREIGRGQISKNSTYGTAQLFYEPASLNGSERIYVADNYDNKVRVFDLNGAELFTIDLMHVKGVVVSDDRKIFCLFRNGLKAYDYEGNFLYDLGGGSGSGDGEFNLNVQVFADLSQGALAIHPHTQQLYALDGDNQRIQVFDQNGLFVRKFGSYGNGDGQFTDPKDMVFLPDGKLLVDCELGISFFDPEGNFLKRISGGGNRIALANNKILWRSGALLNWDGILVENNAPSGTRGIFAPNGDLYTGYAVPAGSGAPRSIRNWKRRTPYPAVNLAPENLKSLAPLQVVENQPIGTIVGEFNASDPEGDEINFYLISGQGDEGNPIFTLDQNGILRVSTMLDYESDPSSYTIRVQVKDTGNAAMEKQFHTTLLNVDDEKPIIQLNGESSITYEAGGLYVDANATWTDNVDGTGTISGEGEVNSTAPGVYYIVFDYTDEAGNVADQVSRTVTVVDTTPPVITLIGDENITHLAPLEYVDQGAVWNDLADGTGAVQAAGSVNSTTPGVYQITYYAVDEAGNSAVPVTRRVEVVDTDSPVITLLGFADITHEAGSDYIDEGAVWNDLVDGTGNANASGTVNVNVPGTYTITYSFTDSSYNQASEVIRTVRVVDTTLPKITLNGDANITLEAGEEYTDLGAYWKDIVDGEGVPTARGEVNVMIPDNYYIYFNHTDTSGNEAVTVTRTIHVVDTTIPVIVLNGDANLTHEAASEYFDLGAYWTDIVDGEGVAPATGEVNVMIPGKYSLSFNHTDSSGNEAVTVTRLVDVVDTIHPVITLNGVPNLNHEAGMEFIDPGAVWNDLVDGNGTTDATGNVNIAVPGTYTITYTFIDSSGNAASPVARLVYVADTTRPVITLNGDANLTHEAGYEYVDEGAVWDDLVDGSGTANASGIVNEKVPGTYTITYNYTDSSGNAAAPVVRYVVVVDTIPPMITLNGEFAHDHEAGTPYIELGAVWSDLVDGNGTAIASGAVNENVPGTYEINYNYTDSSANAAPPVVRIIYVVDTTPPVITLIGDANITHEAGNVYIDEEAVWNDLVDGNGTAIASGEVDINVPGIYELTYNYTDTNGNAALPVVRQIYVVDTTPPVITLIGDANPNHEAGSVYIDEGAVWNDLVDGDGMAIASGAVNENVPGIYEVTYNYTDSSGNAAVPVVRQVYVVDTTPPVITLIGDANITHEAGSVYIDEGAVWNDLVDGNGTAIASGEVDINVPGIYEITYNYTDSSGNAAVPVVRQVYVVDTTPPVITLIGKASITQNVGTQYIELGAVWNDIVDGSGMAIASGTVNNSRYGTYKITYNYTDASGNKATPVVRTVRFFYGISDDPNRSPTDLNTTADLNVLENEPVGTLVGQFTATDPDGDDLIFFLAEGTDDTNNDQFSITVSGELKTATVFNFEEDQKKSILVNVSDSQGKVLQQEFLVSILNGNEPPENLKVVADLKVRENQPIGTFVGRFSAFDQDDDNLSFALVPGLGDSGNVNFTLSGNGELQTAREFDFEEIESQSIRVSVSDGQDAFISESFEVSIIDVFENQSPRDLDSIDIPTVAENSQVGTLVSQFSAADLDGDDLIFKLVNGQGDTDNVLFNLSQTGKLTTLSVLDFEESATRSIRVKVSDPDGESISRQFTIIIEDKDENEGNHPPQNLQSLASITVGENGQIGISIGSFAATDPDGDKLIFSLAEGVGDVDNQKFQLSEGGVLTTLDTFNFEDQEIQQIRVAVSDERGGVITESFEVLIIDQNDFPTGLGASGSLSIQENQPFGTLVGLFSAFDEDGDKLTFSLARGPGDRGNENFTITEDGMLLTATSFDFEEVNVQTIRVSALDGKGGSVSATFEVIILDVFENQPPMDLNSMGIPTIAENREVGAHVTHFKAVDPDGDELIFTLVSGEGDSDNDLFNLSQTGKLTSVTELDFEESATRSVRVEVSDSHGESISQDFIIRVIDHENEKSDQLKLEQSEFVSNGLAGEIGQLKVLGREDLTFGMGQDETNAMHLFLIDQDGSIILTEDARESENFIMTVLVFQGDELIDTQPVTVLLEVPVVEDFLDANTSDSDYHETALMIRELAVVQDNQRNGHNPIVDIQETGDGLMVTTAQPHGRKESDSVVLSGVEGLQIEGVRNWNFMIDEVNNTSFRLRKFGKDNQGNYDGSLGGLVHAESGTQYQVSGSDFLLGQWTFGHLLGNMVSEQDDPIEFYKHFASQWKHNQMVNGWPSDPRVKTFESLVPDETEKPKVPRLTLANLPFRLLAIGNRIDLFHAESMRNVEDAGEGRFVFTMTQPFELPVEDAIIWKVHEKTFDQGLFTLIFEYGQPAEDFATLAKWAKDWHSLQREKIDIGFDFDEEYFQALNELTDRFSKRGSHPNKPNGNPINQVRTNDFIRFRLWQMREFNLVSRSTAHEVKAHPDRDTTLVADGEIDIGLWTTTTKNNPMVSPTRRRVDNKVEKPLARWINQREEQILSADVGPRAPEWMEGPVANEPNNRFSYQFKSENIRTNLARYKFSLSTCSGCHTGDTDTFFQMVHSMGPNEKAFFAPFMIGGPKHRGGMHEVKDRENNKEKHEFFDLKAREEIARDILSVAQQVDAARIRLTRIEIALGGLETPSHVFVSGGIIGDWQYDLPSGREDNDFYILNSSNGELSIRGNGQTPPFGKGRIFIRARATDGTGVVIERPYSVWVLSHEESRLLEDLDASILPSELPPLATPRPNRTH